MDSEASAKTALRALIGALETATEGSRELDVRIACYVSNLNGDHFQDAIKQIGVPGSGWTPSTEEWPRYTTSLDAALSLVPEGWEAILYTEIRGAKLAELYDARCAPREGVKTRVEAATLPLAVVIACLKARSAQGTEARRAETAQQAPSQRDDGPVAKGDAP